MKKIIAIILALTLSVFCVCSFGACGDDKDPDYSSITIVVPDGGPALGMAYLMKEYPNEIDKVKVTYKIVEGTDGIRAAVMSGEADLAIMPTNMAAQVYNGGIDIKLVSTNSYGLLYLLSDTADPSSFTLESLKGQVVHSVGMGGTPQAVLEKILSAANIPYVESATAVSGYVALNFYSNADTGSIIPGIKQGKIHFAVLGEPAVSNAKEKVGESLQIVCDLQEEWKTATGTDASYPQTCLVAKKTLVDTKESLVKTIAKLTVEGGIMLQSDASPYLAELRAREATVPSAFDAEGVKRLHIDPHFGSVAQAHVTEYFEILLAFKDGLIGGKLPDADFYCDWDEMETIAAIGKTFLG